MFSWGIEKEHQVEMVDKLFALQVPNITEQGKYTYKF